MILMTNYQIQIFQNNLKLFLFLSVIEKVEEKKTYILYNKKGVKKWEE
jgi:hypothetical protein